MSEKNLCISCFEPITNPICEWCYLDQIGKWLGYSGVNKKRISFIIGSLKKCISPEIFTDNLCILCGDEEVKICSYCFFVKITKMLKKIKLSEELIQTFLSDFNYYHEKEEEFISIIK